MPCAWEMTNGPPANSSGPFSSAWESLHCCRQHLDAGEMEFCGTLTPQQSTESWTLYPALLDRQISWCYSLFQWPLVSSPPLHGVPDPMFLLFTPLCKLETKPYWLARHCQSLACLPVLSCNSDPVSLTKFPFGLLHRDSALPSPRHLSTTPLLGLPRLQSSWCTAVPCSLPFPVFQVSL